MTIIKQIFRASNSIFFRTSLRQKTTLINLSIPRKMSNYTAIERGQLNSTDYRVFIKNTQTNELVSPLHDIPLFKDESQKLFNMVVEIPRWSNAKMEINKKERLNPISQDVKSNKLRFVNNCFPYHGYIWNYGALPQTFEDPNHTDDTTNCKGDNDPIDVCEIGAAIHKRGSVITVKVLGAIGLIDEGEADWKIIAIDINDPLAAKLNDISDVQQHCTGLLEATLDWFKIYKIPTGKPANQFALDGKLFDREFALAKIAETNGLWRNIVNGTYNSEPEKLKGLSLTNTTLSETLGLKIGSDEAQRIVNENSKPFDPQPLPVDKTAIDTVYYIDRSKI